MELVLASGSPRRRDLLAGLGLEFTVEPPDVDEARYPDEAPDDYVVRVARSKAEAVARPEAVVIAADTTVVHDGHVMGKPSHPAEARGMLRRLAGDAHTVYTGVAVARAENGTITIETAVAQSVVRFTDLTEAEIAAYVETGEPMDKAGAYALQGIGATFVESVEGSPSNVIGLPMHLAARLLRSAGIAIL